MHTSWSIIFVFLNLTIHYGGETFSTYLWRLNSKEGIIMNEMSRDILLGGNILQDQLNGVDLQHPITIPNDDCVSDGNNHCSNDFAVFNKDYDLLTTEQKMLDVLKSTVVKNDGSWEKTQLHWDNNWFKACASKSNNDNIIHYDCSKHHVHSSAALGANSHNESSQTVDDVKLECGKPVNFTYFDHLVGIQNRATHSSIPEYDAIELFNEELGMKMLKNKSQSIEAKISRVEKVLKNVKREKPKSVGLYDKIGNYWRLKGDSIRSIECFRRALAVSPNDVAVLLHLGRLLFRLHYFDDAIYLTRRSLEVITAAASTLSDISESKSVDETDEIARAIYGAMNGVRPWRQHLQLGEILLEYSHYQEAVSHLRHALQLEPNCKEAFVLLEKLEASQGNSLHLLTIFIILILVMGVIIWLMKTLRSYQNTVAQQLITNNGKVNGRKGGEQLHNSASSSLSPNTSSFCPKPQRTLKNKLARRL